MPETPTYTPGQTFQAKVVRKESTGKTWNVKGKPVYRHDLYLVDMKTKAESVKEWISNIKEIPLDVCIEGAYQWFRITKVTEGKNDEVEPFDPELGQRAPLKAASEINNSLPKATPSNADCQVNLQGKSITFCAAWAKDLKVAEIAKRPEGSKVTEEDIVDITEWAIKINAALCDYLNF